MPAPNILLWLSPPAVTQFLLHIFFASPACFVQGFSTHSKMAWACGLDRSWCLFFIVLSSVDQIRAVIRINIQKSIIHNLLIQIGKILYLHCKISTFQQIIENFRTILLSCSWKRFFNHEKSPYNVTRKGFIFFLIGAKGFEPYNLYVVMC